MISRKERRVQKALGTEDSMPLTAYRRIYRWAQERWRWYITWHTYKWSNKFWQWLAFKLPKKLVYYSAIRTWAHATQCPSGYGEDVTVTTMSDAIKRWEKE